ncbi:MAG: hypothetical protein AB8H80_10905 [Planctomycetota bacterium]
MAFSPDGKSLAVRAADLRIFDVASGKSLPPMACASWSPLAWRPDSSHLAFVDEGDVTIFDLVGEKNRRFYEDGDVVLYREGAFMERLWRERRTRTLAYAADGALWFGDVEGRVFRVPPGKRRPEAKFDHRTEFAKREPGASDDAGGVQCMAMAAVGEAIYDLSSHGVLRCGPVTVAVPQNANLMAVVATANGDAVALACRPVVPPPNVDFWSRPDPLARPALVDEAGEGPQFVYVLRRSQTVPEHAVPSHAVPSHAAPSQDGIAEPGAAWVETKFEVPAAVAAIAFHPDGQSLLVATGLGELGVYRAGRLTAKLPKHRSRVSSCALSPDGTVLGVASRRSFVQPTRGGPAFLLPRARRIRPGARGSELVVHESRRVVRIDGPDAVEIASIAQAAEHDGITFGPGASWFVGSKSALVSARNSDAVIAELSLKTDSVADTVFSAARGGRWGACGGGWGNGWLLVADQDGQVLFERVGRMASSLSFSPGGHRIAVSEPQQRGGRSSAIRILDGVTFELLDRGTNRGVTFWRYLTEDRALVCADSKLQLWDANSMTVLQDALLDGRCDSFELSADRRTLACAVHGRVEVYRVEVGLK